MDPTENPYWVLVFRHGGALLIFTPMQHVIDLPIALICVSKKVTRVLQKYGIFAPFITVFAPYLGAVYSRKGANTLINVSLYFFTVQLQILCFHLHSTCQNTGCLQPPLGGALCIWIYTAAIKLNGSYKNVVSASLVAADGCPCTVWICRVLQRQKRSL